MDDDRASKNINESCVKFEWDVVVLPGRHDRGNVGFMEEVALRRFMLGRISWKVDFHFYSIWSLYAALHSLLSI